MFIIRLSSEAEIECFDPKCPLPASSYWYYQSTLRDSLISMEELPGGRSGPAPFHFPGGPSLSILSSAASGQMEKGFPLNATSFAHYLPGTAILLIVGIHTLHYLIYCDVLCLVQ